MNQYIPAKKSLGQNFLQNDTLSSDIVESIPAKKDARIVEIGPGRGALTMHLLNSFEDVIAIEKDRVSVDFLHSEDSPLSISEGSLFSLFEADVLDMPAHITDIFFERPYHIVGNLPFNIGKKIVEIFISGEDFPRAESLTIMLQKEVAEQILGKKRSFISFFVEFFSSSRKKIVDVHRDFFHPVPGVDGMVIQILSKSKKEISEMLSSFNPKDFSLEKGGEPYREIWKLLSRIMKGKRKKIRNTLQKEEVKGIENSAYSDLLGKRIENISLEEFLSLWSVCNSKAR